MAVVLEVLMIHCIMDHGGVYTTSVRTGSTVSAAIGSSLLHGHEGIWFARKKREDNYSNIWDLEGI